MDLRLVSTLAATLATAACGFAPTGSDAPLADRLAARARLDVAADGDLAVTAIARGQALALTPTIVGGEVVLRTTADHYLLVEDLTLPLADVTVPAGMLGPAPVRFTDLRLTLGTQLSVPIPVDGPLDAIVGFGKADLILDWSLVSDDGAVLPLGMRKAPRTPFTVAITTDLDGRVRADLATHIDGTAIVVTDLAALTDLTLAITSASAVAE
ncbi:MAG: hypothetical protein IPL61_18285 [Myxococcales bacterium]|nr:hypothetical protein [Myxococcales bacterium]